MHNETNHRRKTRCRTFDRVREVSSAFPDENNKDGGEPHKKDPWRVTPLDPPPTPPYQSCAVREKEVWWCGEPNATCRNTMQLHLEN
ncbi:hypothetical protein TSUD_160470 [Trifolium subterraneum]|uniref:Uncharacterized protein n=1 Tax=Trifolium subterraneum TaxID=3900 RepID=A0A2Z6MTF6_TRISU|nr:hypothetical protein TSUD_160470 [Trifolium subterraneum]